MIPRPSSKVLARVTLAHVGMMRRTGAGNRRGRMSRQIYPKLIEAEYARSMVSLLDTTRHLITPLVRELPSLLESARRERGDMRMDAGEAKRARELIAKARAQLEGGLRDDAVEALAAKFAQRTETYQRIQLGRQVRAVLGADVMHADTHIRSIVDHFLNENVSLIKTVPTRLFDQLQGLTDRAFTSGMTTDTLAREIEDRFDVGETNARRIARDQIGKLYGQVNASRQKDMGITSFIWRTAGDERVRDEHEILNGEEFSYDDPPDEGLPGEPIQCRCYAEPVFSSLNDDEENVGATAGDDE